MLRIEYQEYFRDLFCCSEEDLSKFECLFDSRPLKIKRQEFNALKDKVKAAMIKRCGEICQLKYYDGCDIKSGLVLDHVIPLYSNDLNKKILKTKALKGKKVPPESFGSNHLLNLVLACNKCNNHKKHLFLTKEQIAKILELKEFSRSNYFSGEA